MSPVASASALDDQKEKKLQAAFKALDENGDGKLHFWEFFALLKKGDPDFLEREAEKLFDFADEDLSGTLDFHEFVTFIFSDLKVSDSLLDSFANDEEEAAKEALLSYTLTARTAASTRVKGRGEDWRKLTWKERLAEVQKDFKDEARSPSPRSPLVRRRSSSGAKAPVKEAAPAKQEVASPQQPESAPPHVEKLPSDGRPSTSPAVHHEIQDMTQEEMVNHSLHDDDLAFSLYDRDVFALREYLKTSPGPFDVLNVNKFLAKGTAGYVFLATDKESGTPVALKLVRMSQARTGMKEWYVSKVLGQAGIAKVVFTYETVRVLGKADAPPVIKSQLTNAGPVPYYMCLLQEFMNGGTLENLADAGKLSPDIMFMALEDVSSTLAEMHEKKVQHKDVKPENVMLEMINGAFTAAKLCDFGSAEIGISPAGRADDVRRFGITMFSIVTGEGWTKRRLIREKHSNLIDRLKAFVKGSRNAAISRLPAVLEQILDGGLPMKRVAALMTELRSESN